MWNKKHVIVKFKIGHWNTLRLKFIVLKSSEIERKQQKKSLFYSIVKTVF